MIAKELVQIIESTSEQRIILPEGTTAIVLRRETGHYSFYDSLTTVQIPLGAYVWFFQGKAVHESQPFKSEIGPFILRYRVSTLLNEEFAISLQAGGIGGLSLPASIRELEALRQGALLRITTRPPVDLLIQEEICKIIDLYEAAVRAVSIPRTQTQAFELEQRVVLVKSRLKEVANMAPFRSPEVPIPTSFRELFQFTLFLESLEIRPEALSELDRLVREARVTGEVIGKKRIEAREKSLRIIEDLLKDQMQQQSAAFASIAKAVENGFDLPAWFMDFLKMQIDTCERSTADLRTLQRQIVDLTDEEYQ